MRTILTLLAFPATCIRCFFFFLLLNVLAIFFSPVLNAQTNVSGNVSGTWTVAGSPYVVTGSVTVPTGDTLTIEAGVEVQFLDGMSLSVDGGLIAMGTTSDSIRFIGIDPVQRGGTITFSPIAGTSILKYVVIERMGKGAPSSAAINLLSSNVNVEKCRIFDSQVTSIVIGGTVSPTIKSNHIVLANTGIAHTTEGGSPVVEANTFSNISSRDIVAHPANLANYLNNVTNYIVLSGTWVSSTATLSNTAPTTNGAKYRVENLFIHVDGHLTIAPGMELQFPDGVGIYVDGRLTAEGTVSDSIRFIGIDPVQRGGSIVFSPVSGVSNLKYAVIERMGKDQPNNAAIKIESTNVDVGYSSIVDCQANGISFGSNVTRKFSHLKIKGLGTTGSGILINNTSLEIENCIFSEFSNGVFVTGGSPKFKNCSIFNNTNSGIQNLGPGIADARSCWWGHGSGPLHPIRNPSGQGNQVSDRVWFNPWIPNELKTLQIGITNLDTIEQNVPAYYLLEIADSLNGATLRIQLQSNIGTGVNEFYGQKDQFPLRGQAVYTAEPATGTSRELLLTGVTSGTHYIYLFPQVNAIQHIQITVEVLDFQILTVSPPKGGNTGSVSLKMKGATFEPGMTVRLENNGVVVATATRLEFVNPGQVFVTFNLAGIEVGNYDLVVQKTNNDTAHWSQSFQVVYGNIIPGAGTGSNVSGCSPGEVDESSFLFIQIEAPAAGRRGTAVLLTIHYENRGSVDIPLPYRILSSQRGEPLSFDITTIGQGTPTLLLALSEPGGPPGILRAGASGSIKVYAMVANGNNEFKLLK